MEKANQNLLKYTKNYISFISISNNGLKLSSLRKR